ncbi:finger protein [Rhypophila decipiens]
MESSFTSRRQATQGLPQFNLALPPPPADIPSTRYPNHAPAILSPRNHDSYYHHHVGPREATAPTTTSRAAPPTTTHSSSPLIAQPPSSASSIPPPFSTSRDSTVASSSILTPKPGIASEGLSPSPGGNSGSSQNSQPGGGSSIYYQPIQHHPWSSSSSGSGHTPSYTYAATNHNSASNSSSVVTQPFGSRQSLYGNVSPSMPQFSQARATNSSTNGENLPNPPSYQEQSAFPTPLSAGGGSLGSSYSQAPAAATHHALSQPVLSSQNSNGTQPPTPTQSSAHPGAPQSGHEGPPYRAPPTPNSYYPPASTPQQSSFPAYQHHHSPTTHSPTTTGAPSRGLGVLSGGMAPPLQYGAGRGHHMQPVGPYQPQYQMHGNPVLSNMHHPGTPLHVVNGMHGYPYTMQHGHHSYGGHSGPQTDRPFKCDECPQSFNRNHDLKRHKRIHLAVKPFPCIHCDKSFSRKDALKRHKLVKGCGSKDAAESAPSVTSGGSPPDRNDVAGEDSTETVTPKREP